MTKCSNCGRTLLYSPHTGEEYSASKGDYFLKKENEVFKDMQGNNMYLVGVHQGDLGGERRHLIKKKVTVKDLR